MFTSCRISMVGFVLEELLRPYYTLQTHDSSGPRRGLGFRLLRVSGLLGCRF